MALTLPSVMDLCGMGSAFSGSEQNEQGANCQARQQRWAMDVVEDCQQNSAGEHDPQDVERDDTRGDTALRKNNQRACGHCRYCARERDSAKIAAYKARDDGDGVDQRQNDEQVCALEAHDRFRPPYGQRDESANQAQDAY